MTLVYLDNAASTKVHPAVIDAVSSCLSQQYGNPSSMHRQGRAAKKAVARARRQVAALINAEPQEIFFTSGGTESNNMALRGFALYAQRAGRECRIITSAVEHDAILEPCRDMVNEGLVHADYVPVDRHGTINVDVLESLLYGKDVCTHTHTASLHNLVDTIHLQENETHAKQPHRQPLTLVSIMYANNEVGTIQPLSEVACLCRRTGAVFHTDAVQAVGKMPVDTTALGVDMLSLSSHKIHGPKGVGALYVRKSAGLEPRMLGGGGQEHGMRSGTENVAGIAGFGEACSIARKCMAENMQHTRNLRDMLVRGILDGIPGSVLNGSETDRLAGNAHFTFLGINGEDLIIKLDEHGIAASTGSACSINKQRASHVLEAMGFSYEQIAGSLRLTLGIMNTKDDVDAAVAALVRVVAELRAVSPLRSKYGFVSK